MQKFALITGANRALGLGFAVASRLAEQDYHVILTGRQVNQAEELAQRIRETGRNATAMSLDLTNRSSIDELVVQVSRATDRLDILVNNASSVPDFDSPSALEIDLDGLETVFAVNVFGVWALTQGLMPLLRKSPAGRIVNITSKAALHIGKRSGDPIFAPAFSLAKHTLNALSATLASALAGSPILVNAVDPGDVASHPERGDEEGNRPAAEAAEGVVWAATLGPDGPTGGFFLDSKPVS